MVRNLLAAALLCLIAISSAAYSVDGSRKTGSRKKPLQSAAKSSKVVVVDHCRLNFVEQALLASGRAGILKFVTPKEGTFVKKGTLVAGLADKVAQAQLEITKQESKNKIDILYAEKAEKVAEIELEKARSANKEVAGTVPDIEILRLKLAAERSTLQIKLAKHKLKINTLKEVLHEAELKSLRIKAPFSGIVTQVFKHQGEAVRQGDPILEIVNPKLIRVEALVPFRDTLTIKVGDRVELLIDLPGLGLSRKERTFHGKVSFIDVSVDSVGKVRVWASVTNRKNLLRSGQTARLLIHPSTAGDRGTRE